MSKFALLILISVILFVDLSAGLYWVLLFDSNYFIYDSFFMQSKSISIPIDSLKDACFIGIIDDNLNASLYLGTDLWNIKNRYITLDSPGEELIKKSEFLFSDFNAKDISFSFDSLKLINILSAFPDPALQLINNLNRRQFLISDYYIIPDNVGYIDNYSILKGLMRTKVLTLNEHYYDAYVEIANIFKIYNEDPGIFRSYINAKLNIGDFYDAEQLLINFYENKEFDEFYYSINLNINAVRGNLDYALKILEQGRTIFPESKILILDAYNLYSVLDSVKLIKIMELIEINNITF